MHEYITIYNLWPVARSPDEARNVTPELASRRGRCATGKRGCGGGRVKVRSSHPARAPNVNAKRTRPARRLQGAAGAFENRICLPRKAIALT
ncbi:unnamed protein product, partial [Iphiclides podalirius]